MSDSVYVTKFVLTKGILLYQVREIKGEMCIVYDAGGLNNVNYFHGHDWHISRAGAVLRAEEIRKAKLDSLRKQISKVENLQWDTTTAVGAAQQSKDAKEPA